MESRKKIDLVVVGGGAAGYMGAIKAAEEGVSSVVILEVSKEPLGKVKISGGGRCNVTNACWEPSELLPNYPRGKLPLIGAFSRFAAGDTVDWFESRGLDLVVEEDGRLFPKSNTSSDVLDCLHKAANRAGVICLTQKSVVDIKDLGEEGFSLKCRDGSLFNSKKVLLATGGNPTSKNLAKQLGHKIIPAVPSLFSFKVNCDWLKAAAGIAIDCVKLRLITDTKTFKEEGRVLITHKGLSGPAVLKLSAFAARKLFDDKYKAVLEINWVNSTYEETRDSLINFRNCYANRNLNSINPFNCIPRRLWISFLIENEILPTKKWSSLSRVEENRLSQFLIRNNQNLIGKGPFGEEFVTAGGVSLDEIDFKTMRSKICENLYFAGEVLNVDGVTGGFNFQHCWTSGWIAGKGISKSLGL